MEKINVHLPENYNGTPINIELREGRANDIKEPKRLIVGGLSIASISAYINGRDFPKLKSENKGVVQYSLDPDDSFIMFISNESDPYSNELTARLEKNPDLSDFKINDDHFFTQPELERFVKKHAHCFANHEKATEFLANLRNFEVRYEQMVKKNDDRKGNTLSHEQNAIKFAKGSIELKWDLRMPLFKGTDPVEFSVDLEIEKDKRTNLPTFGFYSMDVELLLKSTAFDIITEAVSVLDDYFVCLQKV